MFGLSLVPKEPSLIAVFKEMVLAFLASFSLSEELLLFVSESLSAVIYLEAS